MLVHVTTKYDEYDGFCSTIKEVKRIFTNAYAVDFDRENHVMHVHNLDEDGIDYEYVEEFAKTTDVYIATNKLYYTIRMTVGDNDYTHTEDGFFIMNDCVNDKDYEEVINYEEDKTYHNQVIHFVEELNPQFDRDAWIDL